MRHQLNGLLSLALVVAAGMVIDARQAWFGVPVQRLSVG